MLDLLQMPLEPKHVPQRFSHHSDPLTTGVCTELGVIEGILLIESAVLLSNLIFTDTSYKGWPSRAGPAINIAIWGIF